MLSFPNCKINIGLFITNRRNDGYHDLETIFYPVAALHDALEIMPAKETSLNISGIPVAGNIEENLVLKAYHILKKVFAGTIEPLDIYLLKAIPTGAGLGGGSADGAFMLRLLNDYYKLNLETESLVKYALELGSDCPFFIHNTPQFATSRGEVLSPVNLDLSGYTIKIICPEIHISTAKAFSMIRPKKAPYDLKNIAALPVSEWRHHIVNDFEEPVFNMHPQLADIKQQLYNQGALYASMSGSGSSIYGIFYKGQHASVSTTLKYKGFTV